VHYDNDNMKLKFDKIEQAQRELLLLLQCFSSSKPPITSTPYLYSTQYDFFFYEERLLRRSRDGIQLLVWVCCS
jgi:hypothetical protein